MASIQIRKIVNTKYRLRLRPKGVPELQLTFASEQEALEWAEEHEDQYIADPAKYQSWIRFNRTLMKSKGIFHVHRTLEEF